MTNFSSSATFRLLLLTAMLLMPMVLSDSWQHQLEFQRSALAQGELWRLFSGHLVHLGWSHLGMNLLGLWLIHFLFFRQGVSLPRCLSGLLFLMFCTSAGLYLFAPSLDWYRGFSGVLHGLLVWGLLRELPLQPRVNLLVLFLVALKLAWEQMGGAIPGSEAIAQGKVIVDAHLYGGFGGALLWGLELGMNKMQSQVTE